MASVDTKLPLKSRTPDAWAVAALREPVALLNDHAHLEKKAAANFSSAPTSNILTHTFGRHTMFQRYSRWMVAAAAFLFLVDGIGMADEPKPSPTTVVVYDVSELLLAFPGDEELRRARVREMVELIEKTIEPDHWVSKGGTKGAVCGIGESVVARTTPENQLQIAILFDHLWELTGRGAIQYELRAILVHEGVVREVLGEQVEPAYILDDVQAQALTGATEEEKKAITQGALRQILANNQRARLPVVQNKDAVEGGNEPALNVWIAMQGLISIDRKSVLLRLQSEIGVGVGGEKLPRELGGPIKIPNRSTLVLDAGIWTQGAEGEEPRRLLILLKPTVLSVQGDPEEKKAEAGTPVQP